MPSDSDRGSEEPEFPTISFEGVYHLFDEVLDEAHKLFPWAEAGSLFVDFEKDWNSGRGLHLVRLFVQLAGTHSVLFSGAFCRTGKEAAETMLAMIKQAVQHMIERGSGTG